MTSRIEELQQTYAQDADKMASKSRFGYFSLLPSHTAALPQAPASHPPRDQNGRVQTQPRGIYSGPTKSGSLKKTYFSYTPSPLAGQPYLDPGKHERQAKLVEQKKWEDRERYKPASLNKSITSASYEYVSQRNPSAEKKSYRDADGKVKVQPPNIMSSPMSKVNYQSNKQFKHYPQPPQERTNRSVVEEGEKKDTWKAGNPSKEVFNSNYKTYFDADLSKVASKPTLKKVVSHDAPFRGSCISPNKPFNRLEYKEEGQTPKGSRSAATENTKETFRLIKVQHNSKPTPSISCSRTNLLRKCR